MGISPERSVIALTSRERDRGLADVAEIAVLDGDARAAGEGERGGHRLEAVVGRQIVRARQLPAPAGRAGDLLAATVSDDSVVTGRGCVLTKCTPP